MTGRQARYLHGHDESVLHSHQWRTAANSAGYLLPHLRAGMSLLDVGCGPGTITADLAAIVAPGRVVGLDAADSVLDVARAEAAARGTDGIELVVGDAEALDLPADAFDVVHAHQVMHHLGDPVRALREMRRVCRPGGLVAVRETDYGAFAWFPTPPELDEWLARYRRAAREGGCEPDAGRRLLGWAHAAGFTDVTATASSWCFATAEDRSWWGRQWADRVERSALAGELLATGATPADLRRIADAWLAWSEHPDGWFVVLHGEVLCRA